jgi:iron complex transport system permease protein
MGLLAGATLAMVGAVFQALLRNPLATPYTLGISGGGAFGAMIATLLPAWLPAAADWRVGPLSHVQAFACVGTLASMGLIYALARAIGRASTLEILLAGVTLETIFGALTLVARVFADPNSLVTIDRWMMGGLAINGWRDVTAAAPLLAVGLAGLLPMARGLDQLSSGEELAAARGVNVERLQKWAFVLSSVAVAAVVSITGPIGFVGLIVPHGVRRIVGPDHRLLLPCSALAGGAFLVLCDVIARVALAPAELPVGVVTALLGGPFFVYLLTRGRRRAIRGHS